MDYARERIIGDVLRRHREERRLDQTTLATALERPQSFVSKVESGARALRLSELPAYAKALGEEPSVVLDDVLAAFAIAGRNVRYAPEMPPLLPMDEDWLIT